LHGFKSDCPGGYVIFLHFAALKCKFANMPNVFENEIDGYRFFFYSNESNEPVHVHISKGGAEAKYWMEPMEEVYSFGFKFKERSKIKKLIRNNANAIIEKWNEFFK
jgi:hypothetical protein